jgi:hypothetical protein
VGAPAFRHVLNFYRDAGLDALMKRRLSGVSGRTAIPINRVGICAWQAVRQAADELGREFLRLSSNRA